MLARPAACWTPAATLQDVGWSLFSFLMPNSWPGSHPSKIKASGGAVEVLPGSCKLRVKYARTNPQNLSPSSIHRSLQPGAESIF